MISIIMAYYNRQALLDKTLESLDKSAVKDYELIIVDDASTVPLVCDRAKIIRVEKKDKWYTCSSVAYNMGFREATGDIVIIQNPECYHVGDILAYVEKNIKPNTYLSFSCYSINREETISFHNGIMPTIIDYVFTSHTRNGWYNHTKYRPVGYHFCSAIMRKDLDWVGGFDERYACGVAFDDDDLIRRIKCMGMDVKIINNPYVIHQHHSHFEFEGNFLWKPLHTRNEKLYNCGYDPLIPMDYSKNTNYYPSGSLEWDVIESNYKKFYINYSEDRFPVIPKKLHMVWLGGELPARYTRFVETWKNFHPEWEFKIWNDKDAQEFDMINEVAFKNVDNMGVKSDIFRYEILYRHGGLYVDTDFECLKSFDDLLYLDFFGGGRTSMPYLANGLLACKPNDTFIKIIIDEITKKQFNMNFSLGRVLNIAGAEFISEFYLNYIKTTTDKTVLFPDSFFYPIPNSFRNEIRGDTEVDRIRTHSYIKPNTYCMHLWYTSWLPDDKPIPEVARVILPRPHKIPGRRRKIPKLLPNMGNRKYLSR